MVRPLAFEFDSLPTTSGNSRCGWNSMRCLWKIVVQATPRPSIGCGQLTPIRSSGRTVASANRAAMRSSSSNRQRRTCFCNSRTSPPFRSRTSSAGLTQAPTPRWSHVGRRVELLKSLLISISPKPKQTPQAPLPETKILILQTPVV